MDDILDIEVVAEVEVDVENEVDIEIEVEESGPPGKNGKSAYDIYVENGGILTEEEWLNSLKGEPGDTPIKGLDYWTEEDIKAIEGHCNTFIKDQLGIIENGEY